MDSANSSGVGAMILVVLLQLFWLFCLFGFFIIAIVKRKKQIGRRWKHPFSAKLKINDIQLTCHHCKEDHFYKREALIGSTLVTFFHLNYFNQSGAAYTCVKCGHIHWFSRPQESDVELLQQRE